MARWIPAVTLAPRTGQAENPQQPNLTLLTASPAAASTTDDKPQPTRSASTIALALLIVGCLVSTALLGTKWGPTYAPAAGIGAFALFYVAAQAVERLVELLIGLVPDSWTYDKPTTLKEHDEALVAAENGSSDAQSKAAANATAKVEQVLANRTIVAFGLAAALGAILCSYFEASFPAALGIKMGTGFGNELVAVVVTA